jgi:hypothetical protein
MKTKRTRPAAGLGLSSAVASRSIIKRESTKPAKVETRKPSSAAPKGARR